MPYQSNRITGRESVPAQRLFQRPVKSDHSRVAAHFAETTFDKIPDTPAVFDAFYETHGHLTRRRAFVSDDPQLIAALGDWRGVRQVIAVETITSITNAHGRGRGDVKSDIRYF